GTSPRLTVKDARGTQLVDQTLAHSVGDGRAAIDTLAAWLRPRYEGGRLVGVGHRVVHGGTRFSGPTVVTRGALGQLKALPRLAPLHQPHNLAPIEAIFDRIPDAPQVAVFDTGFHRGHAPVASLVPLPREFCQGGVERYGFHGISYEY